MSLIITPESAYGQELAKWNVKRPFAPFPRMLYMARKRPDGVMSIGESDDTLFGNRPGAAEAFTGTCQITVQTESEMNKYMELGWRPTPAEAIERYQAKEKYISDAAAHRAYEDRNMSDAAKAEAAAVEAEHAEHVAEVPEVRRRGRPRKNAA